MHGCGAATAGDAASGTVNCRSVFPYVIKVSSLFLSRIYETVELTSDVIHSMSRKANEDTNNNVQFYVR